MIFKELGIKSTQYQHGFKRGVYFAMMYDNGNEFLRNEIDESQLKMKKKFEELRQAVAEKDEHKKSNEYKKLTPKMKSAVDALFKTMEGNPGDMLSTFDKTVKSIAKKYGVKDRDIMNYFDKEMLTI